MDAEVEIGLRLWCWAGASSNSAGLSRLACAAGRVCRMACEPVCGAIGAGLSRLACGAREACRMACEPVCEGIGAALSRLACGAREACRMACEPVCEAIAAKGKHMTTTTRKTQIACMRIDLWGFPAPAGRLAADLKLSLRQSDTNYIPSVKSTDNFSP